MAVQLPIFFKAKDSLIWFQSNLQAFDNRCGVSWCEWNCTLDSGSHFQGETSSCSRQAHKKKELIRLVWQVQFLGCFGSENTLYFLAFLKITVFEGWYLLRTWWILLLFEFCEHLTVDVWFAATLRKFQHHNPKTIGITIVTSCTAPNQKTCPGNLFKQIVQTFRMFWTSKLFNLPYFPILLYQLFEV